MGAPLPAAFAGSGYVSNAARPGHSHWPSSFRAKRGICCPRRLRCRLSPVRVPRNRGGHRLGASEADGKQARSEWTLRSITEDVRRKHLNAPRAQPRQGSASPKV